MPQMIQTLKDALHDQIHGSGVPIKLQAQEIGISYSYLANAANPDLEEFQFQLRHLLPLCRVTGCTNALDYIESSLGRVSFSLPSSLPCPQTITAELGCCFKEFGEFAETSAKALADNRISSSEAKRIEKELLDLVRQAMSFLRSVQEASQK